MQKERSGLPTADRQAVLRTTKVRATLKGDQSWIQHRSTSQEQEDEKPWITEVRERRNNGALAEPTVTSTPSESPRPVSPGYLIRGVFTKTDSQKDPSSSSANSHGSSADIPKSKFVPVTKKSTDDYKKIAPHGVRHQLSGATQDEPTVSPEEHSKRTEAASSVLRTSGTKQRSYVLSAAKKYESIEKTQSSDVQPALSFKAKRVEFNDEDERSPSKSPEGSTRPIAPVPEPQKTPPVPQPNMQQQPAPGPLSKTSSTATKAGLDSPLKTEGVSPGVNQKSSQVVSDKAPAPRNDFDSEDLASLISDKTDEALVKPVTPKRDSCKQDPSPVADSTQTQKPAMDSKTAVTLEQLAADVIPIDTSTKSSLDSKTDPSGTRTVTGTVTNTSSSDTKTNPFSKTTTPSTVTKISSADPGTPLVDVSPPKAAEKSSSDTKTDPFSCFSTAKTSPSEALDSFDPFPVQPASGPSARKSSSDSLAELGHFSSQTVTPAISKNSSEEPRSLWDEWETPEKTQDVVKSTISRSTDPKTEADRPFDVDFFSSSDTKTSSADTQSPWHMWETPEGTQTVTNVIENSEDSEADETLDELADDVIPIDTTTRSLSTYRSYSFADETHKKEPLSTHSRTEDPSQESQPDIVIFKKTSSEDDSPWDRWMSPVISDSGTTTNRSQDTETKTLTTVTEIRETGPRSSSQSLMESTVPQSSFDPYSRTLETSYTRSDSPESTESKKGYVYVKEYVNTTEMSKLNSGIGDYRRSFTDDITPSSVSYAYSSPTSTYRSVTMTPCTYCGELVGEDAKITVEHLNISCHPRCFKCGVCSKPMGDLLGSMFLHGGLVHCSSCYENVI